MSWPRAPTSAAASWPPSTTHPRRRAWAAPARRTRPGAPPPSGAGSSRAIATRSSRGFSAPRRMPRPPGASSTECSGRSTGARLSSSCACTTSTTRVSSRRSPPPSPPSGPPDARRHLAAPGQRRLGAGERLRRGGGAARRGLRLVRRGLGPRRSDAAGLRGCAHLSHPPRHRHHAGGHAYSRPRSHDGHEPGRHVARAFPPRLGRERPTGDRGLARHPLRTPRPAHPRDSGDRAAGDPRRAPRVQGQRLRAAPPGWGRQSPAVRRQAAAEYSRVSRHALAEEPRDDGRDRRRLAWDVVHAGPRARVLRPPGNGSAPRRPLAPEPRSSSGRLRRLLRSRRAAHPAPQAGARLHLGCHGLAPAQLLQRCLQARWLHRRRPRGAAAVARWPSRGGSGAGARRAGPQDQPPGDGGDGSRPPRALSRRRRHHVAGGARGRDARRAARDARSAAHPRARPLSPSTMSGTIQHVRAGVLDVAYEAAGPSDGVPVVLLHGFPYDVHAYDEVAPALVAAGCRVITPYLRGYGPTRFLSAETPRSGQQAVLGHDLLALMDALGIRSAVLAGYDWGGRAACIVAALWPDRARGLVSGCGYNIQDIADSARPQAPEREHRLWYQYYFHGERGRAGLTQHRRELGKLLWQLWSPNWKFDDATYDRTAASFDNPDFVAVVIQSYRHRFALAPGDPAVEEIEVRLAAQPRIAVPTIVLHGEGDGVSPPSASASHQRFFTGSYERRLVPSVGHNLPQEAPREFAEAILALAHIKSRMDSKRA